MDLLQSQNHKINPSKQNHNEKKTRLTHDQVRLLERSFISNKKLEPERKDQLAVELGIPPRQVAVWYQNKRARWRTQSLELDCSVLQVRLENALAEKSEVEREVVRLRGELKKAKEMLGQVALEYKKPTPPPFSTTNTTTFSISSWCEEEMIRRSSTSFSNNYYDQDHDDYAIMDGHDQVLQLDRELLACLMGSDDDRVVDDDLL